MLGWVQCGFYKKCTGTRYAALVFLHMMDLRVTWCIPVHPDRETSTHYFSCSVGPGAVSIKSASGHLTRNGVVCIQRDLRVM
jgi:hypothetical protein